MAFRLTPSSGFSRFKGGQAHSLANEGDVRALSLHIYCPTYLECCFFENGLRRVRSYSRIAPVAANQRATRLGSACHSSIAL